MDHLLKGLLVLALALASSGFGSGSDSFNKDVLEDIIASVDPIKIRAYLQELSRKPHIAGSERDRELADYIESSFLDFGLDRVQVDKYNLLLSYPDPNQPNKISLSDATGKVHFLSRHKEEVLRPEDDDPDFVDAFLAHTPAGKVEAPVSDLVYVNYATVEDLELLEGKGISVRGRICIARYGHIFRGNKVQNCQDRGAIGAILYSDPKDVTLGDLSPEALYPNSRYLPDTGIQRGGTRLNGDALSPGWTSIENAYRLPMDDIQSLPTIPAQPIGYGDARYLLETMDGPLAPASWVGGIPDLEYHVGGKTWPKYANWTVKLETHNVLEDVADNANVIGVIEGAEEPDRYVIFANHRDAWGFGAVDPSSATAVLIELARVLGQQVKNGWRPRRTILLANWAAEEPGLLGSTEWVFHKMPKLASRTVALVNLDESVTGPVFNPRASPSLSTLPPEAMKMLPDPEDPTQTYYDFWKSYVNEGNPGGALEPMPKLVGSGSDQAPFTFLAGIPSLDITFDANEHEFPGVELHPSYHTAYETFFLVDQFLDPGFEYHKLCTQASAIILLSLAEETKLPFYFPSIVKLMSDEIAEWDSSGLTDIFEANGASLKYIKEAINEFSTTVIDFNKHISSVNSNNTLAIRMLNDQAMQLERVFLMDEHLPGRQDSKHLIYSPDKYNIYGATVFPGLKDLYHDLIRLNQDDTEGIEAKWKELRRHVSDLMIAIRQAASYLRPFNDI